MSKYSEKIFKTLLEEKITSIKILLEEEEDKKDSSLSDMFDSLDKEEEVEEEKEENEPSSDDSESSDVDSSLPTESNSSVDVSSLESSLDQSVNAINSQIDDLLTKYEDYLSPSDSTSVKLNPYNKNNPYSNDRNSDLDPVFDDELEESFYYNKSIKSFINELSTEKDLENIEKKVEKLDQLTKIIDKKFDNKILNIGFEDIDNLVSKSMSLINSCDPVEYAYDEVIRYITVKTSSKDLEDIKDEFSLKFNEACKEEGYDASNITGIANIENHGYKNAISGNSSGG